MSFRRGIGGWSACGMTMLLAAALPALANNLCITNVMVIGRDSSTAFVQFDIKWENSWRYTNVNHDAAWVFFKVLPDGRSAWEHVTLEGMGANLTGYSVGTGTPIEMIVPTGRVGMLVRRSGWGAGTTAVQNVKAVWNIASNSLQKTDKVKIQAFGLEMVYVGEGAFQVGDGTTNNLVGQFEAGTNGTPFTITNESYAITLGGGSAGSLGNNNRAGMAGNDDFHDTASQSLPAAFPKGFRPFYCMKYEITQGQYVDFLHTLTRDQQATRCLATNLNYYMWESLPGSATIRYRNTVQLTSDPGTPTPRGYATVSPDRACNMRWADAAAFADWAGLRPMTELEFEKACRGPLPAFVDEYAWGNATVVNLTSETGDGAGTSTPNPGNANCCAGNLMGGACRVGLFATGTAQRQAAGASYWGIMELCGNLEESEVTVGNASGRLFDGQHGNGVLDPTTGNANVTNWPGTGATGSGFRGGAWNLNAQIYCRVSHRWTACYGHNNFYNGGSGGRAVLTAPVGVGP